MQIFIVLVESIFVNLLSHREIGSKKYQFNTTTKYLSCSQFCLLGRFMILQPSNSSARKFQQKYISLYPV